MKTARISFDDEPDHEYVVRLSPASLRDFNDVVTLLGEAVDGTWPDALRPLFARFGPFLVEWTHAEPVTAEAMEERDPNVMLAVIREWAKGVRNAPLPLPRKPSDGGTSEGRKTSRRSSRGRSS